MGRQQASKRFKTKRMTRGTDQILSEDLKSKASIQALKNQKFNEYLPGLGQHCCVPCAKYFETDLALTTHIRSKPHRKQLKAIKFGPYTHEEAAAGAGRDVAKFLAQQQHHNELQAQVETQKELTALKSDAHRKQKTASGDMEADEPAAVEHEPIDAQGAAEEEISI